MTIGAPPAPRTDLAPSEHRVDGAGRARRAIAGAPADLRRPQLVALAALALTGPAPLAVEHLARATGRRRRSSTHDLEELVQRGLAQHDGAGYRLARTLLKPAAA